MNKCIFPLGFFFLFQRLDVIPIISWPFHYFFLLSSTFPTNQFCQMKTNYLRLFGQTKTNHLHPTDESFDVDLSRSRSFFGHERNNDGGKKHIHRATNLDDSSRLWLENDDRIFVRDARGSADKWEVGWRRNEILWEKVTFQTSG